MRRKKLLRQVAAAAVALSMAVSLSAPAFAAEFNLANGGLVIKADESGITVTQGNGAASTIGKDDEIVITGTYNSAGGAMQTAEENQQEENQPVTPAKAPAKEETPKETPEAEDAPAAEKKQEQKDTEAPLTRSRIPRPKIRITTATLLTRKRRSRMPLQTGS